MIDSYKPMTIVHFLLVYTKICQNIQKLDKESRYFTSADKETIKSHIQTACPRKLEVFFHKPHLNSLTYYIFFHGEKEEKERVKYQMQENYKDDSLASNFTGK